MKRGLRIGVGGATGALGTEVLAVLDASRVPVAELVAVAGERSLGAEIEFQGEVVAVGTELPALRGLDCFISCAPRAAGAELARAALRAEVACIDATGCFASRTEVPLVWAAGGDRVGSEPLVASPVDAALVWLPVLRGLAGEGAPVAVQGTVLEAASAAGRDGIDGLSAESLALFNQRDLPEPASGSAPLAFDLHPSEPGGAAAREAALQAMLDRLLDPAPAVSARWVRVPVFVGQASSLRLGFREPVDAGLVAERISKAPGVEPWSGGAEGPNLRAAAGRDVVIAGAPEADPTDPCALRLWLVADVLRLAAVNAVALAVGALEARGLLEAPRVH